MRNPVAEHSPTPTTRVTAERVGRVLVWSGLGGMALGFMHCGWQVAVEGAQVVAGIVKYGEPTPFSIYQAKLWTLTHQVAGWLLNAGVSESSLSFLISGLLGMISFQALAICVLALCGDVGLAILSPYFIMFTGVYRGGATYPIMLLGSPTYGILGLSMLLLILSLFGAGRHDLAGFLLGLFPCVHPGLAVWALLVVAVSWLLEGQRRRELLRKTVPCFLAGLCISAVSGGYHLTSYRAFPPAEPGQESTYLRAFVRHWDAHRQAPTLVSRDTGIVAMSLMTCTVAPRAFGVGLSTDARFLLRSMAVSGAMATLLSLLQTLPPERLPDLLLILMPSRYLNLNVLAFYAILIGLLASKRCGFGANAVLVALVVAPLHAQFSAYTTGVACALVAVLPCAFLESHRRMALAGTGFILVILGVAAVSGTSAVPAWFGRLSSLRLGAGAALLVLGALVLGLERRQVSFVPDLTWREIVTRFFRSVTVAVLVTVPALTFIRSSRCWGDNIRSLNEGREDAALAFASRTSGLLLTSSNLRLIQLRTRRPVLLDGGSLDMLPYTLEVGPQMGAILKDVHGIDLLFPPEEIRRSRPGALLRDSARALFETRNEEDWLRIADRYHVTNVLTHADWTLRLPRVARSLDHALYSFPSRRPERAADPRAGVPVSGRLLPEEQEAPARATGELP